MFRNGKEFLAAMTFVAGLCLLLSYMFFVLPKIVVAAAGVMFFASLFFSSGK